MPEQKLTGYPSIDKPWLKYYKSDAYSIATTQPEDCTVWAFLRKGYKARGIPPQRWSISDVRYPGLIL